MGFFGKRAKDAAVGLYGKHPAASDFLRRNASSAELRALDGWLSEALTVAQRSSDWPSAFSSGATLFFVHPYGNTALLGALAPSTDRSGRQFPLVIFSELSMALARSEQTWLPGCSFLEEAYAVLARRASMSKEALLEEASRLVPVGRGDVAAARARLEAYLGQISCGAAFEAIFGELSIAERAVSALDEACRSGGSFSVACPLGPDPSGDVALWVRLTHALAHSELPLGMLWSKTMLLLFFGRFTARALLALWSPDHAPIGDLYDLRTVETCRSRSVPAGQPLADWLGGLR